MDTDQSSARFSFTARLAAVSAIAALLPGLVALLVVIALPAATIDAAIAEQLEISVTHAMNGIDRERSQLQAALTKIPQRSLARAITNRTPAIIQRELAADGVNARVSIVTTSKIPPLQTPIVTSATIGSTTLLVSQPMTQQTLDRLGNDSEFALALETKTGRVLTAMSSSDIPAEKLGTSTSGMWNIVTSRKSAATDDGNLVLTATAAGSRPSLMMRAHGSEIFSVLALLLITGLCIAGACVAVTHRMLAGFSKQAARLAEGEFSARLPVVGNDSAAQVAQSMNHLAAQLEDRIGQLKLSLDRFDRMLEAIEVGVVLWNADRQIVLRNRAALEITHMPQDAIQRLDAALNLQRSLGERRIMLPSGDSAREVVVDLIVTETRDGGMLQVFADASKAISIEAARTNFLVTAAHELRTPLVPLMGFLPTLSDESGAVDDVTKEVARSEVQTAAQRINDVVDALFEASLVATGAMEVTLDQYLIDPIIHDAWDAVAPAGVELELHIPDASNVRCDRAALIRVCAAVFDNAIKYGAPPIHVDVSEGGNNMTRIEILNHGEAIPQGQQDNLFEPFRRLDPNMNNGVSGVGLGLYTARRLVEAMNGSITMENSEQGTVAVIEVPRSAYVADAPAEHILV